MKIEKADLSTLTPHPANARRGNISEIAKSLKVNGQYKPLIVSATTRHILAGNHTAKAMAEIGQKQADVIFIPNLDDQQEIKILLADNKTADNSDYSNAKLFETLTDLDDLNGTGFDLKELASLEKEVKKAEELAVEEFTAELSGSKVIEEVQASIPEFFSTEQIYSMLKNLIEVADARIEKNKIIIDLDPADFARLAKK